MLGRLTFDVVRVAIGGITVLLASIALGAHFGGGPAQILGMLLLLALWTLGYTGLYYIVGLRTRSQQKLAVLVPLFLPISLLSTAYVPSELAPGWVRTVSAGNPYSHVVDAARELMAGAVSWHVMVSALVAGTAFIALTQLGAARAFARLVRAE
jgi:ABC-type multidrug transport system permease subunit